MPTPARPSQHEPQEEHQDRGERLDDEERARRPGVQACRDEPSAGVALAVGTLPARQRIAERGCGFRNRPWSPAALAR